MASHSFETALACVLTQEGGFADHPRDPGGPTMMGVTQATLAEARGRPVSAEEVRALRPDEARGIYRHFYWDAVRADELPAGVDLAVFDCAVHSGPRRAMRLLQEVLSVTPDGITGPVTLAAARERDPADLITAVTAARLAFLRRLRTWPVFGRGWSRRLRTVRRRALHLAAQPPAQQQKGPVMFEFKSILASRTVWANLIGLLAIVLWAIGFDTSSLDANAFAEAVVQLVAAASFVASTVFRIIATKQLLA